MIYAYLRVSSRIQDENNQLKGVEEKAKQLNLNISKIIVDKVSGTKSPDQRNLGKLLKRLKAGDILIVSELSRLGRSIFMLFSIIEELQKKGVCLYTVKENLTLDDSIQTKALLFAFGLSAEIERKLIVERTREALAVRKEQGIKLGRPVGAKNKINRLDAQKNRIKRMLKKSYSYSRICKKIKCSPKTLRKFLRTNNADTK